jgi:hypothetical protein
MRVENAEHLMPCIGQQLLRIAGVSDRFTLLSVAGWMFSGKQKRTTVQLT